MLSEERQSFFSYQQIEALDALKRLPSKNSIIDMPIMEIFKIVGRQIPEALSAIST